MNQRPCKNDSSKTRTQYIIRKAAITTAASGAAGYAAALANEDLHRYNLRGGENAFPLEKHSAPWLPGVTAGARMLLTQYLTAYAQTSLGFAQTIRQGSRKKTVSADFMREGFSMARKEFGPEQMDTVFFSQRLSEENHEKKKKVQASISRKAFLAGEQE